MRPKVKSALDSLTAFASAEGLSSRFDDLLVHGFDAWPAGIQHRYPGLADWRGISELKRVLRRIVGVSDDKPVYLANRSTNLMRVGARLLLRVLAASLPE
jgi:hypothetical protein